MLTTHPDRRDPRLPRRMAAPRDSRAAVLGLVALSFAGCAAVRDSDRFANHFSGSTWSGALQQQWRAPDRAIPEGLLLAALPVAFLVDDDFHEDRPHHDLTGSVKHAADGIPLALGLGALAAGGASWADGDDGRRFEIAAESLGATALLTEALKKLVGRKRPDSDSRSSFPSGHASFAFAGATLLIQDLDPVIDPDYRPLEYLLYAPAAAVAVERVEANRHWTSDVVAGALLGVLVANLVHDAHEARDGDARPTIFERRSKASWRFGLGIAGGAPVLGLELRF